MSMLKSYYRTDGKEWFKVSYEDDTEELTVPQVDAIEGDEEPTPRVSLAVRIINFIFNRSL